MITYYIPNKYMADAELIKAYDKGFLEGYYQRHEMTASNMQTVEQMDAFNRGYEDGEAKRNG